MNELISKLEDNHTKKNKDRLNYANDIVTLFNALVASVNGWKIWFGNISIIDQLEKEDLKLIETVMFKSIIPLLELDTNLSKKYGRKEKQMKQPIQNNNDTKMYV